MPTDPAPATPLAVKEFRFYPESEMVTAVFGDDNAQDFKGAENYKLAHHAAGKATVGTASEIVLTDEKGATVTLAIAEDTPHETFEA